MYMYVLGILSLLQILFLPGSILLKIIKTPKGIIQNLVYIFGLSLIFNHIFVVILTHIGANYPLAHYLLFIVEVGLFIYLYRERFNVPINSLFNEYIEEQKKSLNAIIDSFTNEEFDFISSVKLFLYCLFFCWSLVGIFWALDYLIENIGTVFTIWDSVVSWNHWAVEWFSNIHPEDTKRYAQLIPTTYSVTYSFLGSSAIQFFAKGYLPLFGLYFLVLILDLGLSKKAYAYLIGAVVSQFLLKRFYNLHLGSGYVDAAVLFFTFLSVHSLLKPSEHHSDQEKYTYLLLGSIFAAGTALTKQNGLLIVGLYPVLAYLIVLKDIKTLTVQEKLVMLSRNFGISISLLLPWYVFNELRILQGARTNVLKLASSEHHFGRTRIERLLKAYKDLGIYGYLYPIVLVALPLMRKKIRYILVFILLPYTFIWAFFFSSFTRNLSIGLGVLGVVSGHAVAGIIDFVLIGLKRVKVTKWPSYLVITCLMILVFAGGFYFSNEYLIDQQIKEQKLILHEDLNQQIYAYFDEVGEYKKVFTNYPLRFLPGFEDKQVDIGGFQDIEVYREKRAQNPDVEYMLISLYKDNDEVLEEIYREIDQGKAEIVFKMKIYLFVRIIH